ncbi:DinB family protein [Neobacillus pocheonensis]|uniref:DinB family protein n=1 Tax=Neobacillus pocheonensis TaxID=363869 RepID=UPI003D2C2480
MSELLFKSFEFARNRFVKTVDGFAESVVDVQPTGFNNTIHWQVGHVLTVAEQFLFGFPKKSTNLPAYYMELFATGTKPADWKGEVPSVKDLSAQLKEQMNRMKEIPVESFNEKLKAPFLGLETFGEIAHFGIFHEAIHLGQISAMKRVIESDQAK